ncbi:MAG: TolC family protein [Saprospiraceae bacterium]|nr:TolC family protein [Saprospiraceae bacterium]
MRILYVFFLSAVFFIANGQELLTVEDAVSIALKNNFDILVARNDAEIAKVNNTAGNAGMLPSLQLSGSGSYGLDNVNQRLSNGNENNYPSLKSSSINAGTELSWKLFDGGKMFVTKNKLEEIETLGEIQFKEKVLQTIYMVIAAYYDVVRQKQQLISINEAMNYNRERVKIAQAGFTAGSLAKTELLQAKIDLNVIMENAINQQYTIDVAKKYLNELLGKSLETVFDVTDTIPLNYSPNKAELFQRLDSSNTTLLSYQKQIDIARLNLKEYNKSYSPELNFTAGYYFSQYNNSDGTVLNNRSFGPQLGGTFVIPIYSSGENKRNISTAKIQLQSAEYYYQNVELQVKTELQNALTGFENQQQLLEIEKENNELSKENLEISLQRLRLGQTTSLEVHQAQENYVMSCTRLINFEYNLKIAETKLKQMIAML